MDSTPPLVFVFWRFEETQTDNLKVFDSVLTARIKNSARVLRVLTRTRSFSQWCGSKIKWVCQKIG